MNGILELGGFNRIRITREGPILYNVNDAYVGRSIELYGEYNKAEQDLLLSLVDPSSVVVEVGANIGTHTIPLAKRVRWVYAFEPQRIVFQALCANIALNCLANVEPRHVGISDEIETMLCPERDPNRPCNFGGLGLRPDSPSTERCDEVEMPVIPLDAAIGRIHGVDLIKIDVEGMEADVIRGARRIIAASHPILYVENDRADKSEELIGLIRSLDYVCYWHLPPLWNPRNWAANPANVFGGIVSINMVCMPEGRPLPLSVAKLNPVTGPRPDSVE